MNCGCAVGYVMPPQKYVLGVNNEDWAKKKTRLKASHNFSSGAATQN